MRRRFFNILKVTAACGLVVVAAELLVGLFAPSSYSNVVRREGGYGYVPDLRGAFRSVESNQLLRLRTNAQGLRGPDRPWNEAGVLNVVVTGNSFVDAPQMPLRQRFSNLLERRLIEAGLPARVLNLGVNGQEIVNHLDRALWAERRLRPVLVVFVLTVAADFRQTMQTTFRDNRRITYAAGADGMVQREDVLSRWEATVRRVRGWLREFWLVRIGHQLFVQIRNWAPGGAGETAPDACPASLGPDSPQVLAGYRLTEAMVAELARTVGDRLLVLQIPDEAQVTAEGDCTWLRPEKWLAEVGKRYDIATLSLLPAFRAAPRPQYFSAGHLSPDGHDTAATVLFERVRDAMAAKAGQRYLEAPSGAGSRR